MEKLEKKFYIIAGIGSLFIILATIFLIKNPFEIIKGINFDYPMFLVYSIPICLLFYFILYGIFKTITKTKKIKLENV